MKNLYIIIRVLLGLLFVFSGYVKAIDPWGTSIKFNEYFDAMGLLSLQMFSFFLACVMSVLELLVGYLLVFNLQMKWTSRVAFLLMLFFTPLTLWLAITGKVTDCGCFGDAIKLTDWETFYKNVVLITMAFLVLIFTKKYPSSLPFPKQRLLFVLGTLFSAGILFYSYQHLPLIDFRPYKIGSDIQKGMEMPEDAPQDEYSTILKYEKNGVVKEFNAENYPWQDSTWHFVSTEQKLIKKGYTPPIHDFFIENMNGENITDKLLNDEKCLLIVSYKVEKTDFVSAYRESNLKNVVKKAEDEQIPVYFLTASLPDQIENLATYISEKVTFCSADEKMLKTAIRANPGVLLLNKGIIVGKWSFRDVPSKIQFERTDIVQNPLEKKAEIHTKKVYRSYILLAILSIVTLVLIYIPKKKKLNEK
ncbi:MAG: DoxX family protein [Flavobacteriaceae bacterium]|nr:DoxX family protein [Flavobacteriaceae bacterium]